MSKDAAEEIVKGRATGQKVWGEVVAGAIGLTDKKWSVLSPSCLAHVSRQDVAGDHHSWGIWFPQKTTLFCHGYIQTPFAQADWLWGIGVI